MPATPYSDSTSLNEAMLGRVSISQGVVTLGAVGQNRELE